MKVLILGAGGREHALAWKIAQSPILNELYIAPGNGGTASVGDNIPVSPDDFESIKKVVLGKRIDMVVVGPEAPLVAGIYDFFRSDEKLKDVYLIGPSRAGAMLEGSKHFAKEFMERYGIPTAFSFSVNAEHVEDGISFLRRMEPPYVLKADGLAAGKGVLIVDTLNQAEKELREMLGGKFGDASKTVVIEQYMRGIEASVFVLTDGESFLILPNAKDYKRVGERDTGLNTGGMGAISPVPFIDKAFLKKVEKRIVIPTITGLRKEHIPYTGFLYVGLMNREGEPYVVEFNVRMGDPEAQAVIPRIKSDLLELLAAAGEGRLKEHKIQVVPETASTVVLASGGYPGNYEKGKIIRGLENTTDCFLFHAGTRSDGKELVTSGGRVLAVTALAENMDSSLELCYRNIEKIHFEKKYFRKDIGFDLKRYHS
ncbi:MAG TPA: phosphoribosylamine--glycine ligase [Bacteroidetes bacterium]|nr:phosphoribosylamine--glycine ligase [Bacteroidota bacterium]